MYNGNLAQDEAEVDSISLNYALVPDWAPQSTDDCSTNVAM